MTVKKIKALRIFVILLLSHQTIQVQSCDQSLIKHYGLKANKFPLGLPF